MLNQYDCLNPKNQIMPAHGNSKEARWENTRINSAHGQSPWYKELCDRGRAQVGIKQAILSPTASSLKKKK